MTPHDPEQTDVVVDPSGVRRPGKTRTWVRRVGWALGQVGLAVISPADLLVPGRRTARTSTVPVEHQPAIDHPARDDQDAARPTPSRLRTVAGALGQVALSIVSPADLFVPAPRRRPRRPRRPKD